MKLRLLLLWYTSTGLIISGVIYDLRYGVGVSVGAAVDTYRDNAVFALLLA